MEHVQLHSEQITALSLFSEQQKVFEPQTKCSDAVYVFLFKLYVFEERDDLFLNLQVTYLQMKP